MAGKSMAASTAIMLTTTSSSKRVNPRRAAEERRNFMTRLLEMHQVFPGPKCKELKRCDFGFDEFDGVNGRRGTKSRQEKSLKPRAIFPKPISWSNLDGGPSVLPSLDRSHEFNPSTLVAKDHGRMDCFGCHTVGNPGRGAIAQGVGEV